MKIIIDSNRIIAALLKKGTTREILFNKDFEFIAPSYIFSEINKYKQYIIKKTKITEEEYKVLISLIFENIKIINYSEYADFITKVQTDIKDKKDIPYLAVCFATSSKGIWTHDPHFKEQNKIKVYTNIDLIKFSK